jgi:energy-coupling factor transporter ATP-binding protein EcfA2
MEVTISNVTSVAKSNFSIVENKLNIKYGGNGVGKSSIAKALVAKINKSLEEEKNLIPFGSQKKPTVLISPLPNSCLLYNEDYIDNYLLGDKDILNNTISLIKNNQEINIAMTKTNNLLKKLKDTLAFPAINDFVSKAKDLESSLSFNQDGSLNLKSKVGKGLKNGADILRANKETLILKDFIESTISDQWLKWHQQGSNFIDATKSNKCPYCGQNLPKNIADIKKGIEAVSNPADAKSNLEARTQLNTLSEYSCEYEKRKISTILSSKQKIGNQLSKDLLSSEKAIKEELQKIEEIAGLDPLAIHDLTSLNITSRLISLKLDVKKIDSSKQELLKCFLDINSAIDNLLASSKSLQKLFIDYNDSFKMVVARNAEYINDFLKICGIPYKFSVDLENSNTCETFLTWAGDKGDGESNSIRVNATESLSYGEKNALCLILFSIEVFQKNPDIVILDDPISSFDSSKRCALFQYAFRKGKKGDSMTLRNRTVLLLTHDFTPVIDFIKRVDTPPFALAWHLNNKKGIVLEKPLLASDIDSAICVESKLANSSNKSLVVRLVHLRRYSEMSGNILLYNYLSCLFHQKDCPDVDKQRTMTIEEKNEVEIMLTDFNINGTYDSLLAKFKDKKQLLLDFQASSSKYEKLAIARILFEKDLSIDYVKRGLINNVFHIEHQYLFECEDLDEDLIPNYVVEAVEEAISKIN